MAIINYAEFRQQQYTHFLYQYEIPTEYYVSLPMPTRRFGTPAYVLFSSPSSAHPGQLVSVDVPQMWWTIDAQRAKILLYAQTNILPFSKQKFERCTLPKVDRSLDEQEALLQTLENLLTEAANIFFQNETVEINLQTSLRENLRSYLPQVIFPLYQAISPDFFEWLT
jgi:hypothetical protein